MNTRSTAKSLFRKKRSSSILNWFDNLSEEHPIADLFKPTTPTSSSSQTQTPMAYDQPMWAANRAVAPTPGSAIVIANLGENLPLKVTIFL